MARLLWFLSAFLFSSHLFANIPEIVGSTEGRFEVNNYGAATYDIPIKLPPTAGNLAPKLSLRYNSQSGNGVMGLGWKIHGLSYITRCGTNYEQDGFVDGVDFDNNDQYCFGGNRLVPVVGQNGGHLTEYRTEIANFTKVVSYEDNASWQGPERFKVWHKDGRVSEFAFTDDSQIEANNGKGVSVWALNKVTDRSGNFYTVTYQEDTANGDWRLAQINLNAKTTDKTYLKFNYQTENRVDVVKKYYSGGTLQILKLLQGIEIYADHSNDPFFIYKLEFDDNRSDFERVFKIPCHAHRLT